MLLESHWQTPVMSHGDRGITEKQVFLRQQACGNREGTSCRSFPSFLLCSEAWKSPSFHFSFVTAPRQSISRLHRWGPGKCGGLPKITGLGSEMGNWALSALVEYTLEPCCRAQQCLPGSGTFLHFFSDLGGEASASCLFNETRPKSAFKLLEMLVILTMLTILCGHKKQH